MDWLSQVTDADVAALKGLFDAKVHDLGSGTVYFPVRHHSPACCHHLVKLIDEYRPEAILIEGPESGNPLIGVLADEATVPPVALYYTYEHEAGRDACYYPMLACSPEYVALKEAVKRGIPAKFIDLDYHHLASCHAEPENTEKLEASTQDETLLAGSAFIQRLCAKLNCRSFDELWEKVFEIGGLAKTTRDFVQDVFTYCTLSRMCYPESRLLASGDLAREERMRERIAEARRQHERVLVVTGGFHTYGLIAEAAEPEAGRRTSEKPDMSAGQVQHQIYPMAYTFPEADRLNGYASGMPYPNYYGMVWERLQRGKEQPYGLVAVDLIARLTRKLRKLNEGVSTSDAIEAYRMVQDLAALRGKREGGVYELMDAALSSFVKGEQSLATEQPHTELGRMLTGDAVGTVARNPFHVPIVEDFKERCKEAKLRIETTGRHKKVLDLYAKAGHRRLSQLFQCLAYLVPTFAERLSGPDWTAMRDMSLVRETWEYAYSSRIEARLIENSLYGGTLREAATRKLEEEMQGIPDHHSGEMAQRMLQALLMGLQDTAARLYDQVRSALRKDGNFLSLCGSLHALNRIRQHGRLLGLTEDPRLPELVAEAYDNAVDKLAQLARANSDEHEPIIQGLKLLSMLADSPDPQFGDDVFRSHMNELLADPGLPAQLEGVCVAISSGLEDRPRREIVERARAYIRGAPERMRQTALYLQGVFAVSRDAFLYEDELLSELNYLVGQLPYEEFVGMVPELRLAFTYFTPLEIALITERVAGLFRVQADELDAPAMDELDLAQARAWDEAVRKEFEAWKLI
ncbi:hypothetical protein SAMN05661091_2724 [Paenibacillus uliginis N3/975]|uniref:Uncharacterized protein n=1 Tax=Paenibacillus uliginis N3/975 TaxID=1313296 RepID=A0A1X7HE64_9BACL|nr:DUF5682 family protein [Paenibacillus uliginis]SMF84874.1 hypothetical protein SAMN05661091_2724 [Paenibacillus uliginis N3/975]